MGCLGFIGFAVAALAFSANPDATVQILGGTYPAWPVPAAIAIACLAWQINRHFYDPAPGEPCSICRGAGEVGVPRLICTICNGTGIQPYPDGTPFGSPYYRPPGST